MKSEFKPFKAKPYASDWKTRLADLDEWADDPTDLPEDAKQIITFFVREALLNMRRHL